MWGLKAALELKHDRQTRSDSRKLSVYFPLAQSRRSGRFILAVRRNAPSSGARGFRLPWLWNRASIHARDAALSQQLIGWDYRLWSAASLPPSSARIKTPLSISLSGESWFTRGAMLWPIYSFFMSPFSPSYPPTRISVLWNKGLEVQERKGFQRTLQSGSLSCTQTSLLLAVVDRKEVG